MKRSNRFDNTKLPLIMGLISLVSLMIGMRLQESLTADDYLKETQHSNHKAIYEAAEHIKSKFYGPLSDSAYTDAVIYEMIDQLDPYSHYFPEAQNKLYDTYIKGVDKGIGIDIVCDQDTVYIYDVIKGSAADSSNLTRGDILKSINGVILNEENVDTLAIIANQSDGAPVELEILGQATNNTRVVKLNVEELTIPLLEDYILQGNVANQDVSYIKIKRFYSNVFRDFMEVIEKHKNTLGEDVSHLIIDLRDNPGGVVEETAKILNQFFQTKDLPILSTQSKVNKAQDYKSNGRSFLKIDKIVILCNGNSASASEILAGSLQDHDRVVLIGEDTYGKGLIQQNYDLSNNASINLSIGEYILPTGRSIYDPVTEDSSYLCINNKRPLISQKGIKVDIELPACQNSKEQAKLLKNLIIKHQIWNRELTEDDKSKWISSLKIDGLDDNCATETYEYLHWLYAKRLIEDGTLLSSEVVDPHIKKAMEVILSDDYNKITGHSN